MHGLNLDADDLPFAGELLKVREDEQDWEGAGERLLRNFGLSLVPEDHYAAVAAWVDVRTCAEGLSISGAGAQAVAPSSLNPCSLVHKLAIKPDSPFYLWLEAELARRRLRLLRRPRTVPARKTGRHRAGQIKGGGERHERR